MKVYEVFNKKVDWEYAAEQVDWEYAAEQAGAVVAKFVVGKYEYEVTIDESMTDGVYNIEFTLDYIDSVYNVDDSRYNVSGTGNEFLVFATVIDITQDFIAKKHPRGITFSAKEESRMKLYSRFLKQAPKMGLPSTTEHDTSYDRYYIMTMDDSVTKEVIHNLGN